MKKFSALVLTIVFCLTTVALASTDMYDLSNYGYRSVITKGRGPLVFQKSPRGSFMKNHKFRDGNKIYVNLNWKVDGYAIAYEGGEYGYVDASYIDWGSSSGQKSSNNKSSSNGKSSSRSKSSSGSINASSNSSGIVTFSGSVNVRTGPGLDYGTIGSVNRSQTLSYAGETRYDNRGVAWYSVHYNGSQGWVSSKYSSVKGGASSSGKSSSSSSEGSSSSSGKSSYEAKTNAKELSGYYGKNIDSVANALGGGFNVEYCDGEDAIDVTYEKPGVWMAANGTTVKQIYISGNSKYSLLGISVGMSKSNAQNILKKYPIMYGDEDDESVEYVVKGTTNDWEILLDIEYANGRVVSVDYGIWS